MDEAKRKEEISMSYLSMVCAHAGIDFERMTHDADSTDVILKKLIVLDDGRWHNALIRLQLKATSSSETYSETADQLRYRLRVKNYNELCTPGTTPAYLALLILPEDEKDWLYWTPEELRTRGRMYLWSPEGEVLSENSETVNVLIDKANRVDETLLNRVLEDAFREMY